MQTEGKQGVVAAKVGEQVWDYRRPFIEECEGKNVEMIDENAPDALPLLWHSSAHVLGQALELHFQEVCSLETRWSERSAEKGMGIGVAVGRTCLGGRCGGWRFLL